MKVVVKRNLRKFPPPSSAELVAAELDSTRPHTELELGQFYDFNSELTIFVRTFIRVFEYSLTKTQKTDFDTHGFWMDRVNF